MAEYEDFGKYPSPRSTGTNPPVVNDFGTGSTFVRGVIMRYHEEAPYEGTHHKVNRDGKVAYQKFSDAIHLDYLGESAPLSVINEEITFAPGTSTAFDLRTGMIVGQVTATKFWLPWKATATDGSQIAAGIMATPHFTFPGRQTKALATVRGPATVNGNLLCFHTDPDLPWNQSTRTANALAEEAFNRTARDAAAALAFPQLAQRGIKVLTEFKRP
ncbi:head decoration protein [Sphingomonas arantia]|uniref:Head decoration protein n=1 Tax=Sphingomonas arantia TaxID=1460676 RepID=A0ABW4TZG9_9SPHN